MKKKKQTWRDRYPYPLFERKVSLTDSAPACLRHNNLIIHSTVPFYRSLTTTVLRSVIDRRTYPVHQPVKEEELSKRKTNVFFLFLFSLVCVIMRRIGNPPLIVLTRRCYVLLIQLRASQAFVGKMRGNTPTLLILGSIANFCSALFLFLLMLF